MEAIEFKEQTKILAKDQKEYIPLPVFDDGREMISCYKVSFKERIKILFGAKLWLRQLTFGEKLQPQLPTIEFPFVKQ